MSFGNKLFKTVREYKHLLFDIGERITLSEASLNFYYQNIEIKEGDLLKIKTPIGIHKESGEVMLGEYSYDKVFLGQRLKTLCMDQLPIDGLYKLVSLVEQAFVQVLHEILQKYPSKIGSKIKIDAGIILETDTIEELKSYLFKRIINDLTYKTPEDFAKEFKELTGVELSKCPEYNNYIELKATRDLFVHNEGIVNEIYLKKAKTLSRAKDNDKIVCDYNYFLHCNEVCLSVIEFVIDELHSKWESTDYEEWKASIRNKNIEKTAP
ncbi:hypothetical protein [Chryseobacterium rhizosphaerae]|uniref:Uncharacterized protein n=1 Tax=Chryseobacterium rhizosphaerae TaxID=395937 RepID=A0ABX9IJX4_9FLAO|nr:hypothetical protein [Chryseobacterium rhizosphaerae]REC74520.1 hypothetical protein DRF57_13575 [Chryseobacterium rhizosphaerae]GEN66002.1 hypothetical protein CRH01_05700 [Chryseobacterium rhizosphaerae]